LTTLNYGIIGCGMMGREHIQNIQLLDNTRIAAIVEPDAKMQQQAKALAPDTRFVDSIPELLAIENIDCLVIASPNFMHVDQLKEITTIRALPVLVEKPLGTDASQQADIAHIAQHYQAPIWVAMEYRYMPPVAELINKVPETTGGISMLTIREHRFPFLQKVDNWNRFNEKSGGTLVEKCCHFFDLMRLITQSEPAKIMASAGQAHNHIDEQYGGRTSDIWDHGYVIVEFDSGIKAMLELCMFAEGSRYQEEISAVGPNGKIECLVPGPGRFWPVHLGPAPAPQVIISPRNPAGPQTVEIPVDPQLLAAGDHNGSTYFQHQKFQQVVLGNAKPEVTLHDGWTAAAMGMAAQESARTGKVIHL
jgi:predicted dehydrogenase